MKSIFRAATSWLNKPKSEDPPAALHVQPTPPPEPIAPAPAPAPVVSAPVKRERRIEPDPEPLLPPPIDVATINAGPEVKIFTRASKTYATCPHCEASWNLRERVSHPSFRRDGNKGLTCPACDKGVSLPTTLDLRKLS